MPRLFSNEDLFLGRILLLSAILKCLCIVNLCRRVIKTIPSRKMFTHKSAPTRCLFMSQGDDNLIKGCINHLSRESLSSMGRELLPSIIAVLSKHWPCPARRWVPRNVDHTFIVFWELKCTFSFSIWQIQWTLIMPRPWETPMETIPRLFCY